MCLSQRDAKQAAREVSDGTTGTSRSEPHVAALLLQCLELDLEPLLLSFDSLPLLDSVPQLVLVVRYAGPERRGLGISAVAGAIGRRLCHGNTALP